MKDLDYVYILKGEQRYNAWLAWVHSEQYWKPGERLPVPPAGMRRLLLFLSRTLLSGQIARWRNIRNNILSNISPLRDKP